MKLTLPLAIVIAAVLIAGAIFYMDTRHEARFKEQMRIEECARAEDDVFSGSGNYSQSLQTYADC